MDMLRQAIQKLENKRERTPAEQLQLRQLRDDLFWVEFDQSVRAMPNAGVGLVLDRAMDGTLHIIEVVPGGAGTLRRPSCRSRETRLLPPAAACLKPAH